MKGRPISAQYKKDPSRNQSFPTMVSGLMESVQQSLQMFSELSVLGGRLFQMTTKGHSKSVFLELCFYV